MDNRRTLITIAGLVLLFVLALSGLTWVNFRYAAQNPGGNDFLPRWIGTRLFLTEGLSPYSDETTREIQLRIYGRIARPGEDQSLFVYPLYSTLVFAPFALSDDYVLSRALWMTTLELSLFGLAGISLSLSRWRISRPMLAILLLFTALGYHSVRPVINGNAAILCALFIALAFWAIRSEHDVFAGFLLAMASIKPQMVILLVLFVSLWAISHRRWQLFWGFWGSLVLLIASASLFVPDWLFQNLIQVVAYPDYTLPGTPGAIFRSWLPGVGRQMGWVLTVLMVVILFWEWREAFSKDFRHFLWTACLTLVITNLIGIRTATDNFIALFPALVLVLAIWDERWGLVGRALTILSFLLLFFGLWGLFLATLQPGEQPTQHAIMFFPLLLFLFVGLYWVRWWASRPPRALLDELRLSKGGELS